MCACASPPLRAHVCTRVRTRACACLFQVDFNEPHGCALKPTTNTEAGYRPPLGLPTDGLPLAMKPNAHRASGKQVGDWMDLAACGPSGVRAHDSLSAFHRSAKGSLVAAAAVHASGSAPLVGVSGTATAREKQRRAIVERAAGANADLGWSHCLRGQKW